MKAETELIVAFQGEPGAYSEEAALKIGATKTIPYRSFRDVFTGVSRGQAMRGVIPIENSQTGSVLENYDLLLEFGTVVVGEVYLPVDHCLLVKPGVQLSEVKQAYSHPQALAQCEDFLRLHDIEAKPYYDTAGAAKLVASSESRDIAAIASRLAAQRYGLEVCCESIQTVADNTTRFFIIAPATAQHNLPEAPMLKTSLAIITDHTPGALYRALGCFASRGINLTKLESRPVRHRPWQYIFYLDFEFKANDTAVNDALEELKRTTVFLRVFGTYVRENIPGE